MEDQPIRDPRVLEALEACRPGSDDLADPSLALLAEELTSHPELKHLYERLQQLDGKLARAYRDVPVPEGLAERILARLEAARGESSVLEEKPASAEATAPGTAAATESPTAPRATRRFSRRAILAAVATIGAAAAVVLVAVLNRPNPVEITRQNAITEGIQRFNTQVPEHDWRSPAVKPPPSQYPFSREVVPLANMQWAPIRDFLGRSGVVYEMVAPNGTRAALYVVAGAPATLPSMPPRRPAIFTAQRSASAWQSGGLLYVLVVDGNPQKYQQFLDIARGPVT